MRLIDATALTEQIQKLCPNEYMVNWLGVLIDTQPTVKVEPIEVPKPVRHGHWIEEIDPEEDCWNEEVVTCSCCDEPIRVSEADNTYFLPTVKTLKYCPNCGAKMDERKEE